MKRREFIVSTTSAFAALGAARARAAVPCPLPSIGVDQQSPVSTACLPLPSWVPAPGQWAAVGLNRLIDVKGPEPVTGQSFANGFLKIWAGGCYAPGYGGRFGSIIYGPNGGHASYDGSDVYAYDVETRLCSLVRATYNPTSAGVNSFGEYPDGSPCPPHGYDSMVVMSNLGAKGTLVVPQTYTSLADANQRTAISHLLDLSTKTWTRGPDFQASLHPAAAYDSVNRLMWYRAEATAPLTKFDGTSITTYPNNNYAIDSSTVATIDTKRNQFVHWDGQTLQELTVTSLSSPNTDPPFFRPGAGPGGACALEYVADTDQVVGWGDGKAVFTLNPANYAAGWSSQGSGSAVTPPVPFNGCYSKYVYVPGVKCLIGISDSDQVAYAYRLMGT
jgi:hypothetical protein